MMRRTLWNVKDNEEPIFRRTLFKTRWDISYRCCKVIIDNGSLDNLESKKLANELQLQRLKHPKPYHIYWINNEHK